MSDVVSRFNRAWNDHDLEAALAWVTDDVVFESTSPAPDGLRRVGKPAVAATWEPIFADTYSRFDIEDSFAVGDRVVQLWRYQWDGGYVRGVDLIRLRDGKISEKLSYVKG
ncbi:MAG: nuclear transport factor 2 family protein [Actinomycetota bacterium]